MSFRPIVVQDNEFPWGMTTYQDECGYLFLLVFIRMHWITPVNLTLSELWNEPAKMMLISSGLFLSSWDVFQEKNVGSRQSAILCCFNSPKFEMNVVSQSMTVKQNLVSGEIKWTYSSKAIYCWWLYRILIWRASRIFHRFLFCFARKLKVCCFVDQNPVKIRSRHFRETLMCTHISIN